MTRLDDLRYRPAHTVPGEPLILPGSPVDRLLNAQKWITTMGLHIGQVVDSPLVALPIPRYDMHPDQDGRRWSNADPGMLWHPFFWLPPRLTERMISTDEDTGVQTVESDDQWALRVMWELAAGGLYDVESGEWFDVLAWVGLDIDKREDWVRVSEWLLEVSDEILDHIDLEPLLLVEDDPYWAVVSAALIEDPARRSVWARTANHLLSWGFQTADRYEETGDADELRGRLQSILRCASMLLSSVNSDGNGAHGQPGSDRFWAETMSEVREAPAAALPDLLNAQILIHCQNIRDAHWEESNEFWAEYESAAATPGV